MKKKMFLASLSLDADEWEAFDSLHHAIEQSRLFILDMSMPKDTPIYVTVGRLSDKDTCEEMGVNWPYYQIEHGDEVMKIVIQKYNGAP